MAKIGFVGWRGMVGSVLMQRMTEEDDWVNYPDKVFFSTSEISDEDRPFGLPVENSHDFEKLLACDILVTCQGSDWTSMVYPKLKQYNWPGIFIDASSALRADPQSVIVLDPLNRQLIDSRFKDGCRLFVGGNCTTSLMLMALHGLIKEDLVEWVYSSTYQAASGAGAESMKELLSQMVVVSNCLSFLQHPAAKALDMERVANEAINGADFPKDNFGAPLALSLIPWIDKAMLGGQTKEEWKMGFESRKILGLSEEEKKLNADSLCVRVGSLRCHSQSLLVKLKLSSGGISLTEINRLLASANQWVEIVPNQKEATLARLSPAYVSGTLKIPVGRIHPAEVGDGLLKIFTVGDQLLWGAAEPIRRILAIVSGVKI